MDKNTCVKGVSNGESEEVKLTRLTPLCLYVQRLRGA
jgi:hypothetical protein